MAPFVIMAFTLCALLALRFLLLPNRPGLVGPSQITAAMILPLIGAFGMHYAVFAAGVVALIIIAPALTPEGLELPARDAIELRSRLFLFCLPLMPMLICTAAISGLTIVQLNYIILLTIGFAIVFWRDGRAPTRNAVPHFDILLVLMLLVSALIDARGGDIAHAARAFIQAFLRIGLLYFVVSRAFQRTRSPGDLLAAVIVSACVLGVIAAFETQHHWLLYDAMISYIGADPDTSSGYAKLRGGMLRGRATYGESTGLSLFLGIACVMLFALRKHLAVAPWRLIALAFLLASGIVAAFARVGYIVILLGLPLCLLYERNWAGLVRIAVTLPIAVGVTLILTRIFPILAASTGLNGEATGSVEYRSLMLDAGLNIVRDNPLSGLSLQDIYARLDFLKQGEGIVDLVNEPLTIFMRAGVVGGILYFLLLGRLLWSLVAARDRLDPDARAAACACFAGLAALIGGLTTTSFGRNETLYIMLLAAGTGILMRAAQGAGLRPGATPDTPSRDILGRERQPLLN